MLSAALAVPALAQPTTPAAPPPVSSNPPDRTIYRGPASLAGRPSVNAAGVFVIDATAAASSSGGNEPSIAVNPANPNEIALTRFNTAWPSNADLLHSTDGGQTWTNQTSIPVPPGVSGTTGCPCDQTIDFGRDGTLYGDVPHLHRRGHRIHHRPDPDVVVAVERQSRADHQRHPHQPGSAVAAGEPGSDHGQPGRRVRGL